MSEFNKKLEQINLIGLLILIILLCFVYFLLDFFNISIEYNWINIGIIFYFIISLWPSHKDFKEEVQNIFSKVAFKYVLLIVGVNIFFSYGMLYISLSFIEYFPIKSTIIGGAFVTIFISPLFEELLFRGVFFNKLKLIVPIPYALLISSIIFCIFHSYGSYISAFVFGICMAILYIKSNNIFLPIFAHFLNNLIAESTTFIDSGNLIFSNQIIIIIFSILAIVSAVMIFKSIFEELNIIK